MHVNNKAVNILYREINFNIINHQNVNFQTLSIHEECYSIINVREFRRGNQMDNPEKLVHKTKKNKIKRQHNMCLTPLYTNTHK